MNLWIASVFSTLLVGVLVQSVVIERNYCEDLTVLKTDDIPQFFTRYSGKLKIYVSLNLQDVCATVFYQGSQPGTRKVRWYQHATTNIPYNHAYITLSRPGLWAYVNRFNDADIQMRQYSVKYEGREGAYLCSFQCDCDGSYLKVFRCYVTGQNVLDKVKAFIDGLNLARPLALNTCPRL